MQMDLFDVLYDRYTFPKDRPVRVFESFSGIGCQRMAFEKANIPHEVVGVSEIDKFAIKAYEAMHGSCPNLGSISDITGEMMPKDIDLFTYSFPCTDLSKAGQQEGMGEGSRSGLVYEVLRILHEMEKEDNLPQVLIMENVVDLIQMKFINEFNQDIQRPLEKLGYTNYVFTMNAREYGVAQNRDRVFMVSILGEYNYIQPKPFPLEKRLKDYLEDDVEEKYFLSDKMFNYLNTDHPQRKRSARFKMNQKPKDSDGWANTITTRETNVVDSTFIVEDEFIRIPEATKKGYKEAYDGDGVYINRPHQKRGCVQDGLIQTIKTSNHDLGVITQDLRIRKLTPIETGRLMGLTDEHIAKQRAVMSNAQMYKQHGNGIVVDVFAEILKQLV